MKRLIIDIETAPNTAYVWGLFKETIPLARLRETGYVMCWSAKWYRSKEVMFDSVQQSSKPKMLGRIHALLAEADCVIHFNGKSFDVPSLNKEFLLHKIAPPAPYRQVDVLKVVRRTFRFTSNKLDHVADQLGHGRKHSTDFGLWVDCMEGDEKAWRRMERYNKHDVRLLERVYRRVLPWIESHPNHNLHTEKRVCPNCGGGHLHARGVERTAACVYPRYQCQSCGAWSRGTKVKRQANLLRKVAA